MQRKVTRALARERPSSPRLAGRGEASGVRDAQDLIGCSEPMPFGVLMPSQVPLATYFQALPW